MKVLNNMKGHGKKYGAQRKRMGQRLRAEPHREKTKVQKQTALEIELQIEEENARKEARYNDKTQFNIFDNFYFSDEGRIFYNG